MTYDAAETIVSWRRLKVPNIHAVTRIFLTGLLLAFGSTSALAQVGHRCEVYVTNFNTDTRTDLGSFTTLLEVDKPVTKSFQFPETKLIVTASAQYGQSTDAKGGLPSQIVLMIVLGKRAYPDTGEGLKSSDVKANARAVVPLKSFERARVETIFLEERQPIIIGLECK